METKRLGILTANSIVVKRVERRNEGKIEWKSMEKANEPNPSDEDGEEVDGGKDTWLTVPITEWGTDRLADGLTDGQTDRRTD